MLRTTICCSLALTLIAARAPADNGKPVPQPLLYFPLTPVWTTELPAAPAGAPAYDDTTAYIAMTNGALVAVGLADAKIRWSIDSLAAGDLAIGSGLLFVPGFGAIQARSSSDGALKWQIETSTKVSGPIVWDAGWLIAATDLGELLALRADDGTVVWRATLDARMRARPALASEHLYVPLDDGRVIAFALRTGKVVWTYKLDDAASDVLALGDRLFVGSKDNYFYCLDAATGRTNWRVRTGADVVGTPVADRTRVYFVSLDNMLRAVNRSNGVLQWIQPLPLRPPAGPQLVGDLLMVSGVSVNIRGFFTKEGRAAGDYGAPAELVAPPHYMRAVPGLSAAPILMLLMIDDQRTPRLEAMTSELPII